MTVPPAPTITGLIDFALHPPLGLLEPRLDYYGPYQGNNTITTWSLTPGPVYTPRPLTDTYGVMVQLDGALPPSWSHSLGWVSEDGQYDETVYDPPIAQVVVQHQFHSGAWVTTQVAAIATWPTALTWQVALPGRVGLLVAPYVSVDLFWLVGYAL